MSYLVWGAWHVFIETYSSKLSFAHSFLSLCRLGLWTWFVYFLIYIYIALSLDNLALPLVPLTSYFTAFCLSFLTYKWCLLQLLWRLWELICKTLQMVPGTYSALYYYFWKHIVIILSLIIYYHWVVLTSVLSTSNLSNLILTTMLWGWLFHPF